MLKRKNGPSGISPNNHRYWSVIKLASLRFGIAGGSRRLQRPPDLISAVNLLKRESGRQSCLKINLFSGDGVAEFQILGVQEVSSIAGEAGIFKRLAG